MTNIIFKTSIISSAITLIFCMSSCKKDRHPQASIYVIDQNHNPASGISVRFYVKDLDTKNSALDTTILSDSNGIAHYELSHDAYLDVSIQYENADHTYSRAETTADLVTNEHYVDTLIIYKPYVN